MDLVTIITPIYNGEKYLKRYFAQINAIGYKDLQILVVNDGSKDKTSEIVQKYAEEDSRIEFIDKKVNEGVSSARNDALKRAKGVFCFFFDCDDTFDAQIIEKCVAKVKSDTDTVCYNYASVRKNGSILPLCVGLFLVANHAVIFLYGAEFQPTALTIRLLCPLILIKGFGDLYCYQMAYASKNEKIIVPASATASAINVATNAVLIPSLMQNGAVIASVASELITNMVQFVYMKKKVKFKLNMKPLVQSIITVAAMAVCVWKVGTLNFSNTVLLALEVIVGSVVYVVLNILMKNQLMLEVINMTKQRIHNATKKRI